MTYLKVFFYPEKVGKTFLETINYMIFNKKNNLLY